MGIALVAGCDSGGEPEPPGSGAASGPPAAGSSALVSAEISGLDDRPAASAGSEFWEHWGDGRAEMNSYRIALPRYDAPREGELVLIYVTEPHDRRSWIKDDRAEAPDRVEVMKLNASLKFMTGIYPYSVMTSVFSPVDDWGGERFQPTKITLSVQEWCGNYLHQVWPGKGALRSLMVSYFADDGEAIADREVPEGTLYEDGLLIQLREPDAAFADGGSWSGWIVPSLWNVRRGVAPAEPLRGTIERDEAVAGDGTPVTRFEVRYGDYQATYDIEREHPRRILGWRSSVGDTVELVRSTRLEYWTANDPGGRRYREELGLAPGSSGLPPVPR